MGRASCLFVTLLAATTLGGCGSKVSPANYYRVQYGMSEEDVEDLLGPAHGERTRASSTAPATEPVMQKVKSWSRRGIAIHVVFEGGVVVGRSGEGIPGEAAPQKVNSTPT